MSEYFPYCHKQYCDCMKPVGDLNAEERSIGNIVTEDFPIRH